MTDDLIERLAETLRAEASTVTSPPGAWERFNRGNVTVLSPTPPRHLWLGLPAGAVGLAALIALVVMVSRPAQHQSTSVAAGKASSTTLGRVANVAPTPPAVSGQAGASTGPDFATGGAVTGGASGTGSPAASGGTGSGGASTGQSPPVAGAATASPAPPPTPPAGGPVPPGFVPLSVTFVSVKDGWVLGTAPCSTPPCTSIVRTSDGGGTWVGIPAPKAALIPTGQASSGIRSLRFADPLDGWAFGADLWSTHDGGGTWQRMTLPGLSSGAQVTALEASVGSVHAAVLDGSVVRIETSPVDQDAWQAAPLTVPVGAGPVPQVQLVLQGSAGWLIENDRTVVGGARLIKGRWAAWQPPCADVQGPAVLSASSTTDLLAACDVGKWSTPQGERLYVSNDGGASFRRAGTPIPAQGAEGIANPASKVAVVAGSLPTGSAVLEATFDGGATWTTAFAQPSGGVWTELGFTSPSQGVAIVGDPGKAGTMLKSVDGGHHWAAVRFSAS